VPATYTIDVARGLVVTRLWGRLTDEDLIDHQQRLRTDPEFDPGFRQFADFSDVEETTIAPEVIRELARTNPWGAGARRAMLAPSDLLFGLARMFEMLDEHLDEVRVFRNADEARAWLGLDAD